jgi:hypothetical protein
LLSQDCLVSPSDVGVEACIDFPTCDIFGTAPSCWLELWSPRSGPQSERRALCVINRFIPQPDNRLLLPLACFPLAAEYEALNLLQLTIDPRNLFVTYSKVVLISAWWRMSRMSFAAGLVSYRPGRPYSRSLHVRRTVGLQSCRWPLYVMRIRQLAWRFTAFIGPFHHAC